MEALALGHALYDAVDTFQYNHYCVYLVRDEREILYIGKSTRNVVKRLREHIGRGAVFWGHVKKDMPLLAEIPCALRDEVLL